ncbi:MAG: PilZ domain-containing protein, partial [Deltaproteobacteria bacterium]|nr:PilZ domain-containing protein [Deltaproteobacteria bacterium]
MWQERDEESAYESDEAASDAAGEDSPLTDAVVSVATELVEPPPERVRFTAPMAVRLESGGDTYLGAVLNLSTRGVACTVPAAASAGERVWVKFQLGLAEEAVHLLCEVIWRSDGQSGDPIYGLRFASLTPDEEARISAAVSERSLGRAGEWPLPVIPEPVQVRRGGSSVVSAAAGMVAGIVLALVLSVLPKVGVSQPPPAKAPAVGQAAPTLLTSAAAPSAPRLREPPAPAQAEAAPAATASPPAAPAARPAPAAQAAPALL